MVLFGAALFPLYAFRSFPASIELSQQLLRARIIAGLAVFATAFLWLFFISAEMSGSYDWQNLGVVLTQTSFGHIWIGRLFLSALLLFPLYRLSPALDLIVAAFLL